MSSSVRTVSPIPQQSGKGIVFSMPLDALHNRTIDLSPYFTEERYRFINTDDFVRHRTLAIYETPTLPAFYMTISYVWFGVVAEPAELDQHGSFRVSCGSRSDGIPREDGGPISLKVLEYASRWAHETSRCAFLWLDRLCILQTSKRDKAWQIRRMYDIYEQCEQCIVLPGGLQRLASVFEETSWAERAWTYQEAIATWDHAVVLTSDTYTYLGYTSPRDPREYASPEEYAWARDHHSPASPEEVARARDHHWFVKGECHWEYLHQLFVEGDGLLTRCATALGDQRSCLIFGRNGEALGALGRIMEYKVLDHLSGEAGGETIEEHIIRRLVILGVAMRTSSRPVDMVLSIIGVAGVEDTFADDIASFRENERFRATLALVDAVFRQDTTDSEDQETGVPCNLLIDIPLWQSLTLPGNSNTAKMPSLSELAYLLDDCDDGAEVEISVSGVRMKREALPRWTFDVDQAATDDSSSRATAIASQISDADLLKVYHGEVSRHTIQHEEEGVIELCRRLSVADDQLDGLEDLVVFGWALRLEGHPYIRFYKFDITYLFE